MAKGPSIVPHQRKRKTNAETQAYGFYDSAFLADRDCFFTSIHVKRKPRVCVWNTANELESG
jgi:hypothetical protein